MDIIERIKQNHQRGKNIIEEPPKNRLLDILLAKPVSDQTAESLFLYVALEYTHYRGELDSSKSRAALIKWLGLNYRKKDSSTYEISVRIDPLLMKRDDVYYYFGATEIGTILEFNNGCVQIVEHARVLNPSYKHPFVYSDGDICYGPLNWSMDRGVIFNHYYELNNMRATARRIATVLSQGRRNIEVGYLGDDLNPVNDIDEFTPVATSKKAAEAYARRHGIRIIDNDGW